MIRKADIEDIPSLIALLHQVNDVHADGRPDLFLHGHTKYDTAQLEELLRDGDRPVFVSVDDDGTVEGYSFSQISHHPEGGHLRAHISLYIDDICVDETCRGRGIGRQLYEYTEAFAKSIGCHNLTLNIWECNAGAKRFYEALGLKTQKTTLEKIL